MAEIISNNSTRSKTIARHLKIDMTPLVDLAFLLITFFIFTTSMSDRKGFKLAMPPDGPPTFLGESNALTLLLGDADKVFAYTGDWATAVKSGGVKQTSYSESTGIGNLIRTKQAQLKAAGKEAKELMVIIKSSDESTYKNLVDALDEMEINDVKKYASVTMSPEEKNFLFPHS